TDMRRLRVLALTTVAWTVLALQAGCSADDGQNDRGAPANGTGGRPQETGIAGGFAAGADLDDTSIPAPEGGAVARIPGGGQASVYLITYPSDRFDEIVAYYDEWTSD